MSDGRSRVAEHVTAVQSLRVLSRTPAASGRARMREAVMLDLVQPAGAGQWRLGRGWQTRLDEAGRSATAL